MATKRRVIWLGLDGSSIGFYRRFVEAGKLPTFARLMREGVYSDSLPVPPVDTPTNWTALQTGAHAGTTEIVSFFTHVPGTPLNAAHSNLDSRRVKAEFIWEAAERQGKSCIVLNWPCSWPSRLQRSVQVNGTGPLTASWRIEFPRIYARGTIGRERRLDPGQRRVRNRMVQDAPLVPTTDWANTPPSHQQPLGFSFSLLGTDRYSWSEIGLRVLADDGSAALGDDAYVYHALIIDSAGQGYDRVLVSKSRDGSRLVANLGVGDWSDWASDWFDRDRVVAQLLPIEQERVEGVFKFKLLTLSADATTIGLYRTDIWQADGWSQPKEVAAELRSVCGPFTEGLELPSPPSVLFDDWDTYRESLYQSVDWYADAAKHLTSTRDWDLLAVQLHIQDGINHTLARDITPEDWDYDEEAAARAWTSYEAAYVASDRLLGRLIAECGDENTVVCVVSDHGALPTLRECLFSSALVKDGLMAYVHDPATGKWRVDWTRSKVFPRRGHVWVNLKGRDPDGIVDPADFESVREQTIRSLMSVFDEKTGRSPFLSVLRKEDAVIYGNWGDKVGDLITFFAPTYADSDKDYAALDSDPSTTPACGPTDIGCAHNPYMPNATFSIWHNSAVFFLMGPGVRQGYTRRAPITQVDVCPTLCHILGIDPPRDCEGMIASDMFAPRGNGAG